MAAFAEWFWGRYRRNYVTAVAAFTTLSLVVTVGLPNGAVVYLVFRDFSGTLTVVGVGCGLMVGGVIAGVLSMRGELAPLAAWGRREPTDPDEVLDVALRAPQRLVGRIGTLNFVPMELGVTLVAQRQFEFGVAGVFALALGLVMVIGGSTLILGVAVRILYVPVLNEVQPLVDDSVASIGRSWSLRARIILAIATACLAAGLVGGAAGAHVQSAEGRLLAGGVGGLAMAVYGVLLIGFGLILPSVAPVRDLVSAVRRVADGDFTQRVAIASADEFGEVAVAFNNMQRGLRERESLQAAFGSYVDPALAERILAQGDSVFGGEEVDVTVFFADVRGFTTFAAERSAQEAVARLNELFALVVPIIRDNGGHANTYAGDGVLAVFGTPNPLEKHADCAVAAAIEMQRAVHAAFGDELHIGIGVNTGTVIAGTIGGGGKLEFTVIGDAVNVASRVEELTKETGDDILLTQATVDALVAAPDGLTGVGEFPVRGKAGSVRLHAVR